MPVRIVSRGPLRSSNPTWPTIDYTEFSVTWRGSTSQIGDTDMFRLLVLLVEGPDRTGISESAKASGRGSDID